MPHGLHKHLLVIFLGLFSLGLLAPRAMVSAEAKQQDGVANVGLQNDSCLDEFSALLTLSLEKDFLPILPAGLQDRDPIFWLAKALLDVPSQEVGLAPCSADPFVSTGLSPPV